MKQHPVIEYWTPDEVAECIGGIGNSLYIKLWSLVKPKPFTEEPVVEKQNWWNKLTLQEQKHINDCCLKEFPE
jgi:hypothetical protein